MLRSKRHPLTRWLLLLACLSFFTLLVGFCFAFTPVRLAEKSTAELQNPKQVQKPETPPPAILPTTGTLKMVALGDSLTRGLGDSSGLGYIGLFKQKVEKERNQNIQVSNLAISGIESGDLVDQLKQTNVKRLVSEANLILFTIGGNDLFRQSGGIFEFDLEKLLDASTQLSTNYEAIVKQIRSINPEAPVFYTALYNPFGDTEFKQESDTHVQDWNNEATTISARYNNVLVIPSYDLFWNKEKAYLYTDHFHPNHAGYERIANRILQAVK
ncbi:hypothetical protein C2W64_02391 [Brevibacillus laterosporus]|nr:GDSL-type esterase/lipase family protein [Brevibacillus laterosporus]RAP25776.1 hypothetical protein C2W64_02391 [Brevibacillus laterosporus]